MEFLFQTPDFFENYLNDDVCKLKDNFDWDSIEDEVYFLCQNSEEGAFERDYINATILNELSWIDYSVGVNLDGEDMMDQLYEDFPTLRKYTRLFVDEGLFFYFWMDLDEDSVS